MLSCRRYEVALDVRCSCIPPPLLHCIAETHIPRQNCNARPLQVLRDSLRAEGVSFLFKGWTPAFIRLGPNTILMFIFFEVSTRSKMLALDSQPVVSQQLKKAWTSLQEDATARKFA
jgi:hypothetical protein